MRRSDLPHGSINFQPINSIRQEARNEMSFNDNVPKLKPYSRSVSIIGVGATPFVRVLDDPAVTACVNRNSLATPPGTP